MCLRDPSKQTINIFMTLKKESAAQQALFSPKNLIVTIPILE